MSTMFSRNRLIKLPVRCPHVLFPSPSLRHFDGTPALAAGSIVWLKEDFTEHPELVVLRHANLKRKDFVVVASSGQQRKVRRGDMYRSIRFAEVTDPLHPVLLTNPNYVRLVRVLLKSLRGVSPDAVPGFSSTLRQWRKSRGLSEEYGVGSGPTRQAFLDSGKSLSISDDDRCATCSHLTYRPGSDSGCWLAWPGWFNQDARCVSCRHYEVQEAAGEPKLVWREKGR